MKKAIEYESTEEGLAVLFTALVKLTEVGIKNNKEPEEVAGYFAKLFEKVMKKIEKLI